MDRVVVNLKTGTLQDFLASGGLVPQPADAASNVLGTLLPSADGSGEAHVASAAIRGFELFPVSSGGPGHRGNGGEPRDRDFRSRFRDG
jgi:hypothetical protein